MKRRALFVGVNQYKDENFPNLSCAERDAIDLYSFFKDKAGYDVVDILTNPDDKKEIIKEVHKLTSGLGPGDFFLFFFAGHGLRVGENHFLVCSNDFYEDLQYEDDGLPLRQLKRRISGSFDSALILDACQSDIFATRGVKGITKRDLDLILDASHNQDCCGNGSLSIVTSCDEGQTALELSERQHGLFTAAMLDLLEEARKDNIRVDFSDIFRQNLTQRMSMIARQSGLYTEQRPRFNLVGNSCPILLDAAVVGSITQPSSSVSNMSSEMMSKYVSCPQCGSYNLITDTFRCKICGREYLCKSHFSNETGICLDCVENTTEEKFREAEAECMTEEDVKKVHKSAEQGDADAQFELGCCYYNGEGVPQNYTEAVKWFRKSAEQGYSDAQRLLGICYDYGQGVQESFTEAVKWYRKSAEQGNSDAQFELGACYDDGHGVLQDDKEAVKWYRKAAEQGNSDAQFVLGACYYSGQGVSQNYTEAVKWYRKSAEQGNSDAQYNLGVSYAKGQGVLQDYEEAEKWFRKAAEQGNADAQCMLGNCYDNGQGVPQDYKEDVKRYRKAAEQGDAAAQYSLGLCYDNGLGVPQNYTEAVKWYRKAAEQGDAAAQYSLGICYDNGQGVLQDYKEAVKWFRKAAEQGDADAQFELGACYYSGQGVPQSYTEAVKWYRKSAEQGDAGAQFELGRCYGKGQGVPQNYTEAAKWFRKAAEQGNADAIAYLKRLNAK